MNHAAGLSLRFNSNGVAASSPRLLGTSYPGSNPSCSEQQRGSGPAPREHPWLLAATALRLYLRWPFPKVGPVGPTLGWRPQRLWRKELCPSLPQATAVRPVLFSTLFGIRTRTVTVSFSPWKPDGLGLRKSRGAWLVEERDGGFLPEESRGRVRPHSGEEVHSLKGVKTN